MRVGDLSPTPVQGRAWPPLTHPCTCDAGSGRCPRYPELPSSFLHRQGERGTQPCHPCLCPAQWKLDLLIRMKSLPLKGLRMCRSQQVALGEEGPLGAPAVMASSSSLPALWAPSLPWAVDSAPPGGPGPLPSVLGLR